MSTSIDRRLEALEAQSRPKDVITIIRIIALGGQPDPEPFSAEVAGKTIQRLDDETREGFLARVREVARQAARPGCVALAKVWPRMNTDTESSLVCNER